MTSTVYTYPTTAQLLRNCLFLQRPTCEILPSLFEQRGIRFQRGFTLARVDPERRIAYSEEGDEQPFDLLMATPPIHAVDAVRECGLSLLVLLGRRRLARWGLGALVHGLWLLGLLTALAMLLGLLATRRYGFVWETTILGSDTFIALTQALGALPALLGFPLPDAELIRASSHAGRRPAGEPGPGSATGRRRGCGNERAA